MPSNVMLNLGKLGSFMPVYKKPTWMELQKGRQPRKAKTYRGFRRNYTARLHRFQARLDRQKPGEGDVHDQLMSDYQREYPEDKNFGTITGRFKGRGFGAMAGALVLKSDLK